MHAVSHKQHLSQRIREQTEQYLARGGRVHHVPPGVSGRDNPGDGVPFRNPVFLPRASEQTRTPVPEVVAAIEARKLARKAASQRSRGRRTARHQPRRKLIYDDFGEPLRWEWIND